MIVKVHIPSLKEKASNAKTRNYDELVSAMANYKPNENLTGEDAGTEFDF